MAMTTNFLREPASGQVAHSSTSAAFVRNTSLGDWALLMISTSAMMASHTVEATERYGATDSKTQTTYNVWKNTDKPFFDHIKQDKELIRQFASYMKNVTSGKGTSIQHLLTGYDWDSLGEVTVVDVCCIPFPMLREKTCVLTRSCDASSLADPTATPALPSPKHSPISNSSCRTFPTPSKALAQSRKPSHHPSPAASDTSTTTSSTPQTFKDVDVFLLRMIIHDWPTAEATQIIRNLVDSMKPGGKLIIMDTVLPRPGSVPAVTEAALRVRDLSMMQVHNSKERELDEWVALLKEGGDGRLRLQDVVQPFGNLMSVLEVVREDAVRLNGCSSNGGANGNMDDEKADDEMPLIAAVPGAVAT